MSNIYRSLLLVIAGATQKELARQVKYLKVENQILRSRLPSRVFVTPKERNRLLKFAGKLSAKVLHQLVTIVHPETLLRWLREERRGKHKLETANRGRPKTAAQLRRLILKLARENEWGYTRIMGELKKLGIKPPSRNTVKNILKAAGLDPGPQRGEATWDEFLTRHASSLWQCDFFSRRVLTPRGFRQVFVLAFLNVETRRVILSPATYQPDAEWVEAQAQAFVAQAREAGLPVARVMRDRDSKFSEAFDEALRRQHVKLIKTQFRAPNMNAFVERFVQSIQQECLDHFIIFGTQHLDYLCREYVEYYLTERPHQGIGIDNELLVKEGPRRRRRTSDPVDLPRLADIRRHSRLGGLLNSYYRRAA
jgi:putative transposase